MNGLERLKVNPESNVSMTAQLIEQLRWLIASGELETGQQLPPIRELAAQLGIHMHTVRIAYQRLEEDGLVSIHRRRGTIVQEFKPLEMAQSGSKTPTFSIGVLLPNPNVVYESMILGINDVTQRNHLLPLFSFTGDNPFFADRVVSQMVAKQVDGFIVVATGMMQIFEDASRLKDFPPIVFVDAPDMPGYCVLCNTTEAGFLSTQHLIEHGHTEVGMITAPLDWPNVAECYQGYRQALAENDILLNPEWVVEMEDFFVESGYEAGMALFGRGERPKAVFVAADSLAVGVCKALSELGLSIPEDVALTSYNDSPFAEMTHPGLTSSTFPAYQIGVAAAEMLYEAISGREVSKKQVVLESSLVIRQSCGC
jgi:DNA-binding LacI/PurR family transcriptional regulator